METLIFESPILQALLQIGFAKGLLKLKRVLKIVLYTSKITVKNLLVFLLNGFLFEEKIAKSEDFTV